MFTAIWSVYQFTGSNSEAVIVVHIADFRQRVSQLKQFGIFELLVQKETFADAILTGMVSWRGLKNSPLESSCVAVALIENYSTSKALKVSPEKSLILSCYTVVANEPYVAAHCQV